MHRKILENYTSPTGSYIHRTVPIIPKIDSSTSLHGSTTTPRTVIRCFSFSIYIFWDLEKDHRFLYRFDKMHSPPPPAFEDKIWHMVNVIASYPEVTDFRETRTMYLLSNTNFSLCSNFNWIDCGGSFEWSTWPRTKSSGCQLASRLPAEKDEEARSAVRLFVLRSAVGLFPAKPSKFTAYSTSSSSSLVCLENQTNPSCAIIARKSRN